MNGSRIRGSSAIAESPAAGKRQDRAIRTRKELTDAARRIFARDGFELARVEDIAAAAGKTRGAFYANFTDKEDVFFAIFEENVARDIEQYNQRLNADEERIQVLARHLHTVLQDRPRMLLVLEFKLYAIRHPHKKKRLADLTSAMCARCAETDLGRLIPEFALADAVRKRALSAQIGAVLDGLALNSMFYGDDLSEEQILRLLQANLRTVLGTR